MSSTDILNIIIIVRNFGFPNGMAATQRVRLLSRCLVEQGAHVTILCTRVSEKARLIENHSSKGNVDGINFLYTTGTPIRSENFFKRRWVELRGLLFCICKIIQYRKIQKIDSIYLWALDISISRIIITVVAKVLNIPIVLELNERPPSLTNNPSILSRLCSPLWGSSGVIAISEFLLRWSHNAAKLEKRDIKFIKIPILIDPIIDDRYEPLTSSPSILFASSPAYGQTIKFIFDAMDIVWKKVPDCKLVLTGWCQDDKRASGIYSDLKKRSINERIKLLGYLPRAELLRQYQRSWALLIPLFQDIRSQARFPTKIGEYLISSRPIITTRVGEISEYFHDGINAYVCEPDDPSAYGFKIIEALTNADQAKIIGQQGLITSQNCFDYRLFSKDIYNFFLAFRRK
jgi:glycosyltransferase involved in cell wall biosynthesis